MRIIGLEKSPPLREFDLAREFGRDPEDRQAQLIDSIDMHTRLPYLRGGLLAADHKILFGDDGFGQWNDRGAVRRDLEIRLDSSGSHDSDETMPEWVLGLHTPAARATSVLYGRHLNETERTTFLRPLWQSLQRRACDARVNYGSKANKEFKWAYAAEPLADIRVLFGEAEFEQALAMVGKAINQTPEEAKRILSTNVRKRVKRLTKHYKGDTANIQRVVSPLADLKIILADRVEIVEGQGIQFTGQESRPQETSEAKLGELAIAEAKRYVIKPRPSCRSVSDLPIN